MRSEGFIYTGQACSVTSRETFERREVKGRRLDGIGRRRSSPSQASQPTAQSTWRSAPAGSSPRSRPQALTSAPPLDRLHSFLQCCATGQSCQSRLLYTWQTPSRLQFVQLVFSALTDSGQVYASRLFGSADERIQRHPKGTHPFYDVICRTCSANPLALEALSMLASLSNSPCCFRGASLPLQPTCPRSSNFLAARGTISWQLWFAIAQVAER